VTEITELVAYLLSDRSGVVAGSVFCAPVAWAPPSLPDSGHFVY
jgi:hypothetical protein